jgi:hypothetical protein
MQARIQQDVAIRHLLERMLSRQATHKMDVIADAQPASKRH